MGSRYRRSDEQKAKEEEAEDETEMAETNE